jgi:ABC-type uncharacterized transport system substrate-binding protein
MRWAARASMALLLAFLPALDLQAHPHVFISSLVAVDFDGTSLSRISVDWTFDELFSQMIAADYDRGKKGSFTEAEAEALKKGAFDNLRNYHYFLALYLNGKPLALPAIRDFKPTLRAGRLVYSFSLPLALPIAASGSELRITIYDDSYYVAFDKMSPSDVAVRSGDSIAAAISIEKTKVKAEWPGQFMPDQIVLRLKRK